MSGAEFIKLASLISFGLLSLAFLLTIIRIIRGPSLPDRVLALDLLVAIGIAYIAVGAVFTGYFLYLDIAISLGLVGFLATVAFARFILHRGKATRKYENSQNEMRLEEKQINEKQVSKKGKVKVGKATQKKAVKKVTKRIVKGVKKTS